MTQHDLSSYLNVADRHQLWSRFVLEQDLRHVAELGVSRGQFAARMLASVPIIETYLMIDPWRFIPDWNKPANKDDQAFETYFREAMAATDFAGDKRIVLRGTTTEMASSIADESLDFIYIDGDHTLKGISIDLVAMFPKVKTGGWIAGDDFHDSIWQHADIYEPTMVFPFATHFAEAHGLAIHALPYGQFLMQKRASGYRFVDLVGSFGDRSIRRHLK